MGDVKVIYLVIPVFWGYLTNAVTSEDTPLITLSDQCSGDINPSILQGVSDVSLLWPMQEFTPVHSGLLRSLACIQYGCHIKRIALLIHKGTSGKCCTIQDRETSFSGVGTSKGQQGAACLYVRRSDAKTVNVAAVCTCSYMLQKHLHFSPTMQY